jgi:hypothetical protein
VTADAKTDPPTVHRVELVPISTLRAHPRNYRQHVDEQREHIRASLAEHGQYRNVVIARDGTILAGHGVVESARDTGLDEVSAVRLDLDADDPRALKVLAGDNEIARLAFSDEQALAQLLAEIGIDDLLGTGFDDGSFSALFADGDPERPWDEGMPSFAANELQGEFRTVVHFATRDDAARFFELIERPMTGQLWWPEHDGHVGEDTHARWISSE